MISLRELDEIKEKRKTNLYYEEKEYLQYIFLNALSKYTENFVFKGGTCLRICFGLERASEDLDFTTDLSIKKTKEIVYRCLKDFELLGINYKIYAEKEFEGNLRIEIRFEGPLFNGNQSSTNTLKVDFNKKKIKNKVVKVIQKVFSDVPLFTLVVLDEKEILAEKIRALINRAEPRDFYDIWMLINKDVEIDRKLIIEKLKEEKSELSNLNFPSKKEYETNLKDLVRILPSYEQVKKEVTYLLDKLP
ncbi:MAG: nucleotidyl transferase AbiEii/AbiGii toxin family protein [Nanoarchaeota archaeon]